MYTQQRTEGPCRNACGTMRSRSTHQDNDDVELSPVIPVENIQGSSSSQNKSEEQWSTELFANKYSLRGGICFKNWAVELEYLNHATEFQFLSRYIGYAMFLLITVVLVKLPDRLAKEAAVRRTDDACFMAVFPEIDFSKCVKHSNAIIVYSAIALLAGTSITVFIHMSRSVENKVWSMLVQMMTLQTVACVQIVMIMCIAHQFDETGTIPEWASIISTFVFCFFLVVITDLPFMANIVSVLLIAIVYYGTSLSVFFRRVALEQDPEAMFRTAILGCTLAFSISSIIHSVATSYARDYALRKMFVSQRRHCKQQTLIMRQMSLDEKMHRDFLEKMLPPSIVRKLQNQRYDFTSHKTLENVSQRHHAVGILFADIVEFTKYATQVNSFTVMRFLNNLFRTFDSLCLPFDVYKVETVGDCYMGAVGVVTGQTDCRVSNSRSEDEPPDSLANDKDTDSEENELDERTKLSLHYNVDRIVQFAKTILRTSSAMQMMGTESSVCLRIGIHAGSCMSGIVGDKNLRFCLFGDTVNTAARMEQTGLPGAIHSSSLVASSSLEVLKCTGNVYTRHRMA
mmetsp:Transcript_6331/g.16059  ORF Transcript_6331/g.16059 Transcript_6331/m.16059 type:complete len:570 (+) Transcript_6331:390-2099(+)